ncbi:MAG: tRNA uridine-5-carboxymethylaminomethyl(34) synthesis GTPase MnmE [Bacteroidales bacterium]|nr:tRNA uridine-5-carboxymethylaminomethyl(34) synthesis GTPase MnmE [Bacteroidales bacterium]
MDYSSFSDTIAAPATIPGTGAVTMLRISGPEALEITGKVVKLKSGSVESLDANSIRYGLVYSDDGSPLDEVMVSVFRAPRSYTGEDSAEITCHASSFVASEILRLLCAAGARMAAPGEFTRRAFVNGKMDLAQAEAVADVISSSSSASLRVAMTQLRGGFSKELASLRARLVELTSLLELELDFSEEDVEFADRPKLYSLLDEAISHVSSLASSFRHGNAIRNGVPVAIVGAVNAGKSTLLNSLLGDERAIVSDIPGTTRDTVEETMTVGGILFRFIDTAGLRTASDEVEKIGISRSYKKLSEDSVVLAVLDVSASEEENETSISEIVSKIDPSSQKLIVLLNKADILSPNINVSLINNLVSSSDNKVIKLYISAKTGFGLDLLKTELVSSQKNLNLDSDQVFVTNQRHFQALLEAGHALENARSSLALGLTPDLVAEDLRSALHHLGTITGEVTPDELLGQIFSRFCIGK